MSEPTTRPPPYADVSTQPTGRDGAATMASRTHHGQDHETTSPSSRRRGHIGLVALGSWLTLQDKMTQLSTNSVHRILPNATHASLIEDQHDSTASVAAIPDVVQAVRSGRPLHP
jgi:hypothetical protein